jgi:lipopolysaccharide export system permease protein
MVFLFIMQLVWKYIDDIAGKGIEWYYVVELLFFWSAGVIPMALPIAVLLSSLMTIGNFGENYELAAMKSAGVSLFRIMRPMFGVMIFVAIGAFYFSNYVIPVANLKAINLIHNMSQQKPTFNIVPGAFYGGISNFSLKVGSKGGEHQEILQDIFIYDHRDNTGNNKVTVAKEGEMRIIGNNEYLELTLKDGHSYEDVKATRRDERQRKPFIKSSFEKSIVRFSLQEFQSGDLRENNMKNFFMYNTTQLMAEADSIYKDYNNRKTEFANYFADKYSFRRINSDSAGAYTQIDTENFIQSVPKTYQKRAIQNALRMARGNREYLINTINEYKWRKELHARHYLEWHKKFALSVSCIILFFIGAPLGAIIRKGGLGMPVVVSVVIFLIFHILNMMFDKMGRQLALEPWLAIWLPSMILAPAGIFLTQRAASDSGLMSAEAWKNIFKKITSRFKKQEE